MVKIPPTETGNHRSDQGEHDRLDRMLDMALDLTFPGSDPVAITILTNQLSEVADLQNTSTRAATPPRDCEPYRRTAIFTQDTIPNDLLRAHRAVADVWALIHVIDGRLLYRVSEPTASEIVIESNRPGLIEPAVLHQIAPLGAVRFYIEFHRIRERA